MNIENGINSNYNFTYPKRNNKVYEKAIFEALEAAKTNKNSKTENQNIGRRDVLVSALDIFNRREDSKVVIHSSDEATDKTNTNTDTKTNIIVQPDGTTEEIQIDPKKVDPKNASYVEMLALSAHLKQERKIDGPAGTLATMVFNRRCREANAGDINEKQDFAQGMKDLINNALENKQMDTYLRYLKEVNIYNSYGSR